MGKAGPRSRHEAKDFCPFIKPSETIAESLGIVTLGSKSQLIFTIRGLVLQ